MALGYNTAPAWSNKNSPMPTDDQLHAAVVVEEINDGDPVV